MINNNLTGRFIIYNFFPVIILTLIGVLFSTFAGGQARTGEVVYESLGIKFVIPDGWKGQETGEGFVIGHDSQPGFIMLTTHNYKQVDQISQQARAGIHDQNGTNLHLTGELNAYNSNGMGGEFSGTMQWQPARLYIIALINQDGFGVMITSGTNENQYSEVYRKLAEQVAASIVFSKPVAGPVVTQWKQRLSNMRLTYMDSYYSTGGGYSSKTKIDLCNKGFFNYISRDNLSIDTGGAYGYSGGNNQGNGTWDIVGNTGGGATLVLRFNNGEVREYELSTDGSKTLLNGQRYFVTDGSYNAEDGPQCY